MNKSNLTDIYKCKQQLDLSRAKESREKDHVDAKDQTEKRGSAKNDRNNYHILQKTFSKLNWILNQNVQVVRQYIEVRVVYTFLCQHL